MGEAIFLSLFLQTQTEIMVNGSSHQDFYRDSPDGILLQYRSSLEADFLQPGAARIFSVHR